MKDKTGMGILTSNVRGILVLVFAIVVFVFGSTRLYPLIAGPSLTLKTPSFIETTTGAITLSGTVARNNELIIAGMSVLPTDEGHFSRELFIQDGHTILEVVAKDRRGRSVMQTVHAYSYNQEPYGIESESENTQSIESESGSLIEQGGTLE